MLTIMVAVDAVVCTFWTASGVIESEGSGASPPTVKKVDVVDHVLSDVRRTEICTKR